MNEEINFELDVDIGSEYTPSQLIFSNSCEQLFKRLKHNLFASGSHPFSKRLVIVPSREMEGWIRLHLARDLGIAAGIETSFLENALHALFEMEPFPSKLELTLRIEAELTPLAAEWEVLENYLKGKEKRKVLLAKQLASLFSRYGVYGNQACSTWEKEPKNWQEVLWQRVFADWNYPLQMVSTLQTKSQQAASIHLFAFSHIPALYFHFFQQLPNVYFYQLSPCQEFWSDLTVEHPILTHVGRVGREMARLTEESELITEELYVEPEGKFALHQLQRELLYLERGERVEDDSLQLHISTTEYHEIQNLYETVKGLLGEGDLEPRDIFVMAPNISSYEPFIRAIFTEIPYQIGDMQLDPDVEALYLLLNLDKRRWSAPALLEIFNHPLFQKKMGWNEEDVGQIRRWIESTGIRWGLDVAHREALLKKRHCKAELEDEGATWKQGIAHLLEELAMVHEPKRIDFTQAELLGEWKSVLDQLKSGLAFLEQTLTLRSWVDELKRVYEAYFYESDPLFSKLERLARASRHNPHRLYSFEMVHPLLGEVLTEKSVTVNAHQLQSVRFCSLLPMRSIPAKVICLIGMNHDTFPRQEHLYSLDLLKNQGDYCPSRLDFDRFLFLEVLLSVREKLIISYLGCDPYDQTAWPPSSVVTQLLPYISTVVKHPPRLPLKSSHVSPTLFAFHEAEIAPPIGRIDLMDFVRPFRSPLRHYLYHREIFVRDERVIQEEEALRLSPLRRAILRKKEEKVWNREGDFPLGPFAQVARMQLKEDVRALPNDLHDKKVDLKFENVHFVGTLDALFSEGLCVFEKKSMRAAVKAWPLFLLLCHIKRETHTLLFARDGKRVERFFDDPAPYLRTALEYYALARQMPTPLFPEWIEPILKGDPLKLEKAMSYDSALKWVERGQTVLPADQLIVEWKEVTEKLYKEMADAWF